MTDREQIRRDRLALTGYGRYDDDPEHVGCPRAQSDMTPCIARDGASALADITFGYGESCVGCDARPEKLLREIGVTPDGRGRIPGTDADKADQLRVLVRELTEDARAELTDRDAARRENAQATIGTGS